MSLKKIIEQYNFWPAMTGRGVVLPTAHKELTQEHAKLVYNWLESALSPENLHRDGEITRAQAMAKYRMYHKAIAQLEVLGWSSEGYYFD